jgi:toxin ParE1/3/4
VKLRWSAEAGADATRIQRYIAHDSVRAAGEIRARLAEVAKRLLDQPQMGREGRIFGTRELVVTRSPYLLIYRVREDAVEILRVIHGSQVWPPRGRNP